MYKCSVSIYKWASTYGWYSRYFKFLTIFAACWLHCFQATNDSFKNTLRQHFLVNTPPRLNILPLSYAGNWEMVKSIAETKFEKSHVCLHSQVGNRLWQLVVWHLLSILIHFQNYNEIMMKIWWCYYIIISVEKLT